jgi:cytoskeletal protein CcmA (bactofilin family)
MTDQVRHNPFVVKTQVNLDSLYSSSMRESGQDTKNAISTGSMDSSGYRLIRYLSQVFTRFTGPIIGMVRYSFERTAHIGGVQLIFRRENRGESFQRQIDNLRQQPGEPPAADEEQEYEPRDYEADEFADTSRFATDQGTPPEGISYPATRAEPEDTAEEEAAPAAAPRYQDTSRWQAPSDSATSVIASSSHWNGTLKSEGSLRIHGRADGELHSATDLFVAEGAEVDAALFAESVVVAGLVRGKIEARVRLEIMPQGEVTGDVRSPKLVVHEGATISGQLKMEGFESQSTYSRESNPSAPTNET